MTAPCSGSTYTNGEGVARRIALSVSGGSLSGLTVAGATWPAALPVFTLEPGETFKPTYTGTLTVAASGL